MPYYLWLFIQSNDIQFWNHSSSGNTSQCHCEWEIKGSRDRDHDLPSNPRRASLQFASKFPRPIETLSHRRHRYNNVACQSIRPISRELKLQRGSFRVNFPAIKTGNVRNCGEIAVLQLPSSYRAFRQDFDAGPAFIIDRVTSTSTLTKWRRVAELTPAFRLLPNYAVNLQLSISH